MRLPVTKAVCYVIKHQNMKCTISTEIYSSVMTHSLTFYCYDMILEQSLKQHTFHGQSERTVTNKAELLLIKFPFGTCGRDITVGLMAVITEQSLKT